MVGVMWCTLCHHCHAQAVGSILTLLPKTKRAEMLNNDIERSFPMLSCGCVPENRAKYVHHVSVQDLPQHQNAEDTTTISHIFVDTSLQPATGRKAEPAWFQC